jgi:Domain of unknown function (DUF932)
MELFKANRQWATRPADERFETLQSLYEATKAYAATARENIVPISIIRAEANGNDVNLTGKAGNPAVFTHWSFGQLCGRIGAPAAYLRELPATLACQNINHGLANYADKSETANLLFHANGNLLLRAFTSEKYSRIWNWEVAERLLRLQDAGWTPATVDKRFDGGDPTKCQVCNGLGAAPNGDGVRAKCQTCKGTGRAFPALYASDHDMFAFVRNSSAVIREPGNADGLQRGVIVENSEVGASALKLTRFLYREMCGNHIIWGASKVIEISVRHVGDARQRWSLYQGELKRYAESSVSDEEAKIASAKTCKIGDTKEQVLDRLFGMRTIGLSRKCLEAGYDAAQPNQDGDPRTVWGMVQGLTRHSQTIAYADTRTGIDRAAGKLMEADF